MSRILGAKKTRDDPAVGANVHTDGNALAYIVGGDVSFAGGGGTDLPRGDGSGVCLAGGGGQPPDFTCQSPLTYGKVFCLIPRVTAVNTPNINERIAQKFGLPPVAGSEKFRKCYVDGREILRYGVKNLLLSLVLRIGPKMNIKVAFNTTIIFSLLLVDHFKPK